jgi:HlyD family secretion protein
MDVPQTTDVKRRRRRRRALVAGALVTTTLGATYALGRLEPGAPIVDRSGLWIDTVKRGVMVRDVRGAGALVPDEFVWLAAETEGRVDDVVLRGGATVTPDTVILVLSNPETEQAAIAATLAWNAAEAAYKSLDAALRNELLQQRVSAAAVESDHAQAAMQAEVDASLAKEGLLAELTSKQSTVRATSLETRLRLERERIQTSEASLGTRLDVQRAEVENRRTVAELRQRDLAALRVRATMTGVLQEVVVDEGQRVTRGANLARVANPTRLKAELRIPETQTRDLRIGLPATIDTHNGLIQGELTRIDPAAQNGTVTVDVTLRSAIPPGARPDMTVDGTIQLERVDDALFVGRPAISEAQGTISVFRLAPDGARAERTTVRIGRTSTSAIEILNGLREGDQIILSDTSAWEGQDAIAIR